MLTPDWLSKGPVAKVLKQLEASGHAAFVVGGAVRNTLMERPVKDFDIATSATPDEVTEVFEGKARIVPTGAEHGTLTVLIDGSALEVTTFRRDVSTDGRRAVVAFSKDPEEDARRRDFTMNAIYLDLRGEIFDPTGGVADAKARRLRFIGDAGARIREDNLRSLRFFRLFAEYGEPRHGFDEAALDAIASHVDGLRNLSIERITDEIVRLLSAPDPSFAVAGMEKAGVLGAILPGATLPAFLELVHIEIEERMAADPMRRLAALVSTHGLRLSRRAGQRFALLRDLKGSETDLAEIAWRHGGPVAKDVALLRAAGLSMPLDKVAVNGRIAIGSNAVLPISATDLMPEFQGKALGEALDRATAAWIASDFALDKTALISIAHDKG